MLTLHNETSGRCLIWKASIGGWFGHLGGILQGSKATFEIHPEEGLGLVIVCNKDASVIYPGHEVYGLVRELVY